MRDAAYRRISAVRASRKTLIVPSFAYAATWIGVSEMLASAAISNTNPFSIKRPITAPNSTFVAAVRWSESPYVYRYKLWDDGVLYFPVYNGEQIGANAYLELWSVADQALAAITSDWTLTVSKLVLPDLCQCILNFESTTLALAAPTEIPAYQYCNPLCTPLCS